MLAVLAFKKWPCQVEQGVGVGHGVSALVAVVTEALSLASRRYSVFISSRDRPPSISSIHR